MPNWREAGEAYHGRIISIQIFRGSCAEARMVSLRHRAKGDLGPRPLEELVEALQKEVAERLRGR